MIKRLTALTISLIMILAVIQFKAVSVFALTDVFTSGGLEVISASGDEFSYDSSTGLVTISEGGAYEILYSTDKDTIKVMARGDVTLILHDASITSSTAAPIEIAGEGDVEIKLRGSNYLTSSSDNEDYGDVNYAGIQKTSTENTLTITSITNVDTGDILTVQGGYKSAGIGGA
ncbi:MAG: carbohydrate-binding domain-containing protein [Clostridiales bacterium]|nr:carbohydrate-binding domain-containing protein [Clostridiales bacterium]